MQVIKKFLGIWAMEKTVSSAGHIFAQLLINMAAITLLMFMSLFLAMLLVSGITWISYEQLLRHGYDSQSAIVILGGMLLALISALALATQRYYRRVRQMSRRILHVRPSLLDQVTRVSDAFMDGLLTNR